MNASTGWGLNTKESPMYIIKSPLKTFHRLNNVIIGRNYIIGYNVRMLHNVTISEVDISKTTIIEDDVLVGAGAVILNNAHIGKYAKIGANCVVTSDVLMGNA